jgi:enoyl-CoA hydratase/carnithine racemase
VSEPDVTTRIEGAVGILSFNRPGRANAVRAQTLQQVCAALDAFQQDSAVASVVLRGEGKHFCAGADVEFLDALITTAPLEIHRQVYAHFQGAARRLFHFTKPTVALVSGAAVTVGCELALACDFRLVSATASFQESWIKLGLIPPLGGLFLLPRFLGLARAKQMVLRAEALDANTAVSLGLALEVVPREELEARGLALAQELARLPALAYAAAKAGMHAALEGTLDAQWSANVLVQAALLGSEDFKEGVSALKDKRTPGFRGR